MEARQSTVNTDKTSSRTNWVFADGSMRSLDPSGPKYYQVSTSAVLITSIDVQQLAGESIIDEGVIIWGLGIKIIIYFAVCNDE